MVLSGGAVLSGLLVATAMAAGPGNAPARRLRALAAPPSSQRPRGGPPVLPAVGDVVGLAEYLSALVRAGLSESRVWPVLADRAGPPEIRRLAAAVTAAHRRGEATGPAIRTWTAEARSAPAPRLPRVARRARWGRSSVGPPSALALTQLALAIDVSDRTGCPLADLLDRFTAALRADLVAAGERATALAGPRATATILSLLPGAGLVLAWLVGARPWHVLLATAPGRVSLAGGGALWLAGRLVIRVLVRRAEADP